MPTPSPRSSPDDVSNNETKRAIEAVVMAAIEPVEPQFLAQLTETPVDDIEALCAELMEEYERDGRGFTLARVAGGYRYQTHPDMAPYIERFVLEGQSARLSGPALETLAIIAYKQPVSRAQLAAIRGVSVESTIATLIQRGYVAEIGHDPGPGQAILYGTTVRFLEQMGVDSLDALPPLAEFIPDASVVEALERGLLLRVEDNPTDADSDSDTDERSGSDETRGSGDASAAAVSDGDLAIDLTAESEPDATPE